MIVVLVKTRYTITKKEELQTELEDKYRIKIPKLNFSNVYTQIGV